MKTIKLFLLVSIIMFTISCKKQNTKPAVQNTNSTVQTPTQTSIVGSWKFTSLYYSDDNGVTWQQDGGTITPDVLAISSDGTYSCSTRDFTRMGQPTSMVPDNGIYTNSDSLVIHSNISLTTLKSKVVKLSATELWVRYGCACYEVRFAKN